MCPNLEEVVRTAGRGGGGGDCRMGVGPFLRMCHWRSFCTLNSFACQMRVTVCDPALGYCVHVTSLEY